MIDYVLIRKSNKRMYLRIKNGQVVVTAPRNVSKREIDAFVNRNTKWIESHLKEPQKGLFEGDTLHLFDRDLVIHYDGKKPQIAGQTLILPKDQKALEFFIRQYSQDYLMERLNLFAKQMGEGPVLLKLGFYKSKWGSCKPSTRTVTLNLNLIYSDRECIDAVIVHELAHFRVMNHSADFYRIVESVLPDYRVRMKRLKKYTIPFID